MRTIGIRVAPKIVTFVIYDSDVSKIINVEDIKVPLAFTIPDALKYIRNNLLDILREYKVSSAGIRIAESTAQRINIERVQNYKKGSLNKLIESRFLTVREIVIFGCQIASGLHNVHSKKLIHFDIKPDNILLSERGEALISDFGLSKYTDIYGKASQDRMYFRMIPPEALNGEEFTVLFDIYQLGLTLYRMCNGNTIFYEQFHSYGDVSSFDRDRFRFDVKNGRFPDRDIFLEHIPDKLRKIIKKCLEPNPTNRYCATIEVANALAEIDGKVLDWQFCISDSSKVWTKLAEDREYKLVISDDGTSLAKKTTGSGRSTRIRDYCKQALTSKEIKKFLGDY